MTREIIRGNDTGQKIRTVTKVGVNYVPEAFPLFRQARINGDSAIGLASETYNIPLLQSHLFYPVFRKRNDQS